MSKEKKETPLFISSTVSDSTDYALIGNYTNTTTLSGTSYRVVREPYHVSMTSAPDINQAKPIKEPLIPNIELLVDNHEFIVMCTDPRDLSPGVILKTLSAMKGKLMMETIDKDMVIEQLICDVSPMVRKNLVDAGKRLRMYGKQIPVIARFDEFGRRLPDEINIDGSHGVALNIVNPETYGPFYLELIALVQPNVHTPELTKLDWTLSGEWDSPF